MVSCSQCLPRINVVDVMPNERRNVNYIAVLIPVNTRYLAPTQNIEARDQITAKSRWKYVGSGNRVVT